MQGFRCAAVIAVAFVMYSRQLAAADEVVLDVAAARWPVRRTGRDARLAHARIGDAEALRVGAAVRFPDDPELEIEAGPRIADDVATDVAVRLGQALPLGRSRASRPPGSCQCDRRSRAGVGRRGRS